MSAQLLQLMAHVFVNILEGVKTRRGDGRGSGAVFDAAAKVLFGGVHQAAVGVVDDHEFLGAQLAMRGGAQQGAQAVIGDDACWAHCG